MDATCEEIRMGAGVDVTCIYNTCALSKHIGNMCTRLRNGENAFPAFRTEYTYLPICFDSAHVLYVSCNLKKNIGQAILVGKCCHCRINVNTYISTYAIYPIWSAPKK